VNTESGKRKLRLPFPGSERLERNFSYEGQDLFVLSALAGKRNGVFLDLGSNHPIVKNNTFLLEREFDWRGLCVDIDDQYLDLYVFRKSGSMVADCTKLDWESVIDRLGTTSIDYLSLDLEPPPMTLECLRSIPFERLRFAVITFEHDAYRSQDIVRQPSRRLFEEKGYRRICSDVRFGGNEFEDWYCDPNQVDIERCSKIAADKKDWEDVIFL